MNALMLIAGLCIAAPSQEFDMAKLNRLVELRQSVDAVQQLEHQGYDVNKDKVLSGIYTEASQITGKPMDYDALKNITGQARSPMEKFTGFFTFVNILYVTGAILGVCAVCWLFGIYILALLLWIPVVGWEFLFYAASIGLVASGMKMSPDWCLLTVLPGCLGFMGCFAFTELNHFEPEFRKSLTMNSIQAWGLTAIWGLVALLFNSHIIGFLTIMAFMSALHFVAGVIPGIVYVGWDKEDHVPRATFGAGLMLFFYIILNITGNTNIRMNVFFEGMNFMGSFVYFLGILIMSSRWYGYGSWNRKHFDAKYWVMQALCIASCVAAIWLGTVFGMTALLGVGGTLFYLYIIEKYYEIPWKGSGWAWSLLGLAGMLYGFGIFAQSHPQYFIFMPK